MLWPGVRAGTWLAGSGSMSSYILNLLGVLALATSGVSQSELVIDLNDASNYSIGDDATFIDIHVPTKDVRCLASFEELVDADFAGLERYLLSNDGGASWTFWNGSHWVTGATRAQSNSMAELADGMRRLDPLGDVQLRVYLLDEDSVPPFEGITVLSCSCGDGVVDSGEMCDDGNGSDGDGCSSSCRVEPGFSCHNVPSECSPVCGNSILNVGEGCDDGNLDDGDGCSSSCWVEVGFSCQGMPSVCAPLCGNGIVEPGEACDDGNVETGDGCGFSCYVERGYACEGSPSRCAPRCGDGVLEGDESCDDGNGRPADGCAPSCASEPGWSCHGSPSSCAPTCGNGVLDEGEACDDGNPYEKDGCSSSCLVEAGWACAGAPSLCEETCGNGTADFGEACDDGNIVGRDGCSSACAIERGFVCTGEPSACKPICGDGIVSSAEQCDDGNRNAHDGCGPWCVFEQGYACFGEPSRCLASCGNGVLEKGESCDDGNQSWGDGCTPRCQVESGWRCRGEPADCIEVCGNGVVSPSETCDDGDLGVGDGCSGTCRTEAGWMCQGRPSSCEAICGDGLLAGQETCDDGNTKDGDGCSSACLAEALLACGGGCADGPEKSAPLPPQTSSASFLPGTTLRSDSATGGPQWVDGRVSGGGLGCAATSGNGSALLLALALIVILARARRFSWWSLSLFVVASLVARHSRAQGLDWEQFSPASSPSDLLVTRSASTLGALSSSTTLSTAYAHKPLLVRRPAESFGLVEGSLSLVLAAQLGVAERMNIGASISWIPYQRGSVVSAQGGFLKRPTITSGVGTAEIETRVALLREESAPLALAIVSNVTLPVPSHAPNRPGVTRFTPMLAVSRHLDALLVASNVGVAFDGGGALGDLRVGARLVWRVGAAMQGSGMWPRLGFELLGTSNATRPSLFGRESPVEGLASARWPLGPLHVSIGLGTGLTRGYGAPVWRASATVGWSTSRPPASRGLLTDPTQNPKEVLARKANQNSQSVLERDAPSESADSVIDSGGEPTQSAGCVDFEEPQDVPCSNDESTGPTPSEGVLRQPVFFAIGAAELKPRALEVLDQVARLLLRYPGLRRVRITGHTDSSGPREYNHKLSLTRAVAVRDYLVGRGIEPERLVIEGLGEDNPRADESSGAGAARNRRVQIVVVERAETPAPSDNDAK